MLVGTTIPEVDYIQAYREDVSIDRPMAIGPPYAAPLAMSTPVARLDATIDRLTRAAKFPGEQWAQ